MRGVSFGHGRVFHVSRNSIFGLDGQYILTLHIPWKAMNRLLLLLKLLTHMYMCVNSFLVQEPCNFFSPLCTNNLAALGIKTSQDWLGS